MQIEIWSDVVCPFCFIGKHRLEEALKKFPQEKFDITWKSFQLNPDEKTNPDLNHADHLAESKGWSKEYMQQAHQRVCAMGESCAISFDFDHAKVVNSFNAHRLLHYAKTQGKQNELKEFLFKAYFEQAKNIGDNTVLAETGVQCGLKEEECLRVLNSSAFAQAVEEDKYEAVQYNIRGVPCFVFDGKYVLSGAMEVSVFENVLQQVLDKEQHA